jgi:biopolymer transport protein ExbD
MTLYTRLANRRLLVEVYPIAFFTALLVVTIWIWVSTPFCGLGRPQLPVGLHSSFVVARQYSVQVNVLAGNRFWCEGYRPDASQLADALAAIRTAHPEARLLIAPDEHVPFASAKTVLHAGREYGFAQITLLAEKPPLPLWPVRSPSR